jgi:hypothetical protein
MKIRRTAIFEVMNTFDFEDAYRTSVSRFVADSHRFTSLFQAANIRATAVLAQFCGFVHSVFDASLHGIQQVYSNPVWNKTATFISNNTDTVVIVATQVVLLAAIFYTANKVIKHFDTIINDTESETTGSTSSQTTETTESTSETEATSITSEPDAASQATSDTEICHVCKGGHDGTRLMLCSDGCGNGAHCYCIGLDAVPAGEWYCSSCRHPYFHNQNLVMGKNVAEVYLQVGGSNTVIYDPRLCRKYTITKTDSSWETSFRTLSPEEYFTNEEVAPTHREQIRDITERIATLETLLTSTESRLRRR